MTRYEIKSLSIGGILDQTVALVKDRFGVLLAIAAVVYVPYGLINGFVMMAKMPPRPAPPFEPAVMQQYQEAVMMAGLFTLPASLLFGLVGVPLANGAMIWAVSQSYLGEPVSFDSTWRHSLSRALPLIGTTFLYSLAMMGGFILCVIPGFLFMLWFIFYAQGVMLEGLSGSSALSRSKALMKGNMGKAFVLMLLLSIISAVIGGIGAVVPQPHVGVVLQVALQAVVVMFSAAAMTVFYFSCRCDHEDFDLMRLAAAVEKSDNDASPDRGATY
ncbi:hypothetical protein [Lacipirellula limnantheis]|uniref:Glycerophosphoryl diester phosphodiesterase membrane domain-containing protein n=1 Tax=Lacipirellula limnantheis TaxID=2528024 RepID=A0A517U1Y0_9BACT|nr:hypothetical protein [Lacipirellula limnantheis]QDT74612.1 hypothetical protein I41_38090 [Lacipirellula limnantheis]